MNANGNANIVTKQVSFLIFIFLVEVTVGRCVLAKANLMPQELYFSDTARFVGKSIRLLVKHVVFSVDS